MNEDNINNEETEKQKKHDECSGDLYGDGIPVHYYNFWDYIKYVLLLSAIIALFTTLKRFEMFVWEFYAIEFSAGILLFIVCRSVLRALGIMHNRYIGTSVSYRCPSCENKVWYEVPHLKMPCPHCKEKLGYHEGKVYKINSDNESYFKSDAEKTVELLQKQVPVSSNYLEEIKQLKQLLDMGAITEKEFNEKKKELLK